MPPNLHPRSAHTTTLFGTTLLVSFLVVSLPHLFPCPVPSRQYLDANTVEVTDQNGRRVYKRVYRKPLDQMSQAPETAERSQDTAFEIDARSPRECPVPKPRGFIGRWLGFSENETTRGEGRPEIVRLDNSSNRSSEE